MCVYNIISEEENICAFIFDKEISCFAQGNWTNRPVRSKFSGTSKNLTAHNNTEKAARFQFGNLTEISLSPGIFIRKNL